MNGTIGYKWKGFSVNDISILVVIFISPDAQQFTIGSCSEEDIACVVVTRVLGQYPKRNQLLIDAGWSAVSLDGKLANGSYGLFQGQPHLRYLKSFFLFPSSHLLSELNFMVL